MRNFELQLMLEDMARSCADLFRKSAEFDFSRGNMTLWQRDAALASRYDKLANGHRSDAETFARRQHRPLRRYTTPVNR